MSSLLLLLACHTEPTRRHHRQDPVEDSATPQVTGTTGETATDTGPPPVDPCLEIPSGPFPYLTTTAVTTEEDFDFDIGGYLITQSNTSLAAIDRQGQSHIIAPTIGVDAAGIRSLVTGDIVIAQPDTGALVRVNYNSGAGVPFFSGLSFPNGIEAATDGYIYSSEYVPNGKIRMIDPYTGDALVIAELQSPNNMALSPDERTLYVVVTPSGGSKVVALDRDDAGVWSSEPRLIHDHENMLGGITTDSCGNIYIAEYSQGRVYRLRINDLSTLEPIADLPSGNYSSARFTSGIDPWGRTELFVTSRWALYVIDVGVAGRHVLASP